MIKKSAYLGVTLLCFFAIVACEKDFTDIGSSVVDNSKFNTGEIILDVEIVPKNVATVRADGLSLSGRLGQYLLGVYNKERAKKIEATLVTQLGFLTNLKVVDKTYGADTTVVTKIDDVFIKLPYESTSKRQTGDTKPKYELDSIFGNTEKGFSLKVYRSNTYLNRLNPNNPTKLNEFLSNATYEKTGAILNTNPNLSFKPSPNDTVHYFDRHLSNGKTYKDSLKLANAVPFAVISLDKNRMKTLFLDKYGDPEFSSIESFTDYFRGLIIEASGNEGSLMSLAFTSTTLLPSLEVKYTNSIIETKNGTSKIVDTIAKTNSFSLSGIRNSVYKMTPATMSVPANNVILQGTAGSLAEVKILGGTQLQDLRSKNWLINDASLTLYVNKSVDTTKSPKYLFLNKQGANNQDIQVSDIITFGPNVFSGRLSLTDKKPEKYNFRITDYISKVISGKAKLATLELKVRNGTDSPGNPNDTIVRNYNWNPRSIILHDHAAANGVRRAQLKISYTEKK